MSSNVLLLLGPTRSRQTEFAAGVLGTLGNVLIALGCRLVSRNREVSPSTSFSFFPAPLLVQEGGGGARPRRRAGEAKVLVPSFLQHDDNQQLQHRTSHCLLFISTNHRMCRRVKRECYLGEALQFCSLGSRHLVTDVLTKPPTPINSSSSLEPQTDHGEEPASRSYSCQAEDADEAQDGKLL